MIMKECHSTLRLLIYSLPCYTFMHVETIKGAEGSVVLPQNNGKSILQQCLFLNGEHFFFLFA